MLISNKELIRVALSLDSSRLGALSSVGRSVWSALQIGVLRATVGFFSLCVRFVAFKGPAQIRRGEAKGLDFSSVVSWRLEQMHP